jgi:hypothetical protein
MKHEIENIEQNLQIWCAVDKGLLALSQSLTSAGVTDARDVITNARQSLAQLMDSVQDDIYARAQLAVATSAMGGEPNRSTTMPKAMPAQRAKLFVVRNGS